MVEAGDTSMDTDVNGTGETAVTNGPAAAGGDAKPVLSEAEKKEHEKKLQSVVMVRLNQKEKLAFEPFDAIKTGIKPDHSDLLDLLEETHKCWLEVAHVNAGYSAKVALRDRLWLAAQDDMQDKDVLKQWYSQAQLFLATLSDYLGVDKDRIGDNVSSDQICFNLELKAADGGGQEFKFGTRYCTATEPKTDNVSIIQKVDGSIEVVDGLSLAGLHEAVKKGIESRVPFDVFVRSCLHPLFDKME